MNSNPRLGDLQLRVLRALWESGSATVADVQTTLGDVAYQTVATALTKLERKGLVAHDVDGRTFVYRPAVRENEVHRSLVANLTEQLFEGSSAALVNHLLTEQQIDPEELAQIRALLEERDHES